MRTIPTRHTHIHLHTNKTYKHTSTRSSPDCGTCQDPEDAHRRRQVHDATGTIEPMQHIASYLTYLTCYVQRATPLQLREAQARQGGEVCRAVLFARPVCAFDAANSSDASPLEQQCECYVGCGQMEPKVCASVSSCLYLCVCVYGEQAEGCLRCENFPPNPVLLRSL